MGGLEARLKKETLVETFLVIGDETAVKCKKKQVLMNHLHFILVHSFTFSHIDEEYDS